MLPRSIEPIARWIEGDRRSGAIEIALATVDLYISANRAWKGKVSAKDASRLASRIKRAHPSMAAISNAVDICDSMLRSSGDREDRLRAFRDNLSKTRQAAASNAAKALKGVNSVATLTWSSTVIETLSSARDAGLKTVHVLESRPGGEGRRTARLLSSLGLRVFVAEDAAVQLAVKRSEASMVGADTVLADGSIINKAGTFLLALTSKEAGKPFIATAESIKFDGSRREQDWTGLRGKESDEIKRPAVGKAGKLSPMFDITPPSLITCVATEDGFWKESWADRMAASLSKYARL